MVKLQDFAKQQGVTDRQIQRLLKKYEEELDGLFERRGQNGTWLSDDACNILRGKMKTNPIVVLENENQEELERLRERIKELEERVERKDILIESLQAREKEKDCWIEDMKKERLLLEETNRDIRGDMAKLKAEVTIANATAEHAEKELEKLKNRTFWERLTKRYE